mgnify:CR=1 FL=1
MAEGGEGSKGRLPGRYLRPSEPIESAAFTLPVPLDDESDTAACGPECEEDRFATEAQPVEDEARKCCNCTLELVARLEDRRPERPARTAVAVGRKSADMVQGPIQDCQ